MFSDQGSSSTVKEASGLAINVKGMSAQIDWRLYIIQVGDPELKCVAVAVIMYIQLLFPCTFSSFIFSIGFDKGVEVYLWCVKKVFLDYVLDSTDITENGPGSSPFPS